MVLLSKSTFEICRKSQHKGSQGAGCTILLFPGHNKNFFLFPVFFWDAWDLFGSCEQKVLCFVVVVVFCFFFLLLLFRTFPNVLCFSAASEKFIPGPGIRGSPPVHTAFLWAYVLRCSSPIPADTCVLLAQPTHLTAYAHCPPIKRLLRYKELEPCSYKLLQGNKTTLFFKKYWTTLFFFFFVETCEISKINSTSKKELSALRAASKGWLFFWGGSGWGGMFVRWWIFWKGWVSFVSSQRGQCGKQWRTKGHHSVVDTRATNCCCFHQPYVQLHSFYSAAYGTIIIEFFLIIDLTCIILFILAELIQADWD